MTFHHDPHRSRRRWWQHLSREAIQASAFVIVLAVVLAICYAIGLIR